MYNFQLGVDFAVDNFAECPPYMRETYHELAEAVNMLSSNLLPIYADLFGAPVFFR